MIRNEVPTTPENFTYYSHHPPLIVWMPAVTTIFLGENELAVRFGFQCVADQRGGDVSAVPSSLW